MEQQFDIQSYMTKGVERVVKDALRATMKDPRESVYMVKFASASKRASAKRAEAKKQGENIPPFLIASITSRCNLHCAGCYSRHNHATEDKAPVKQLLKNEWERIFLEARDLGISFILLAGGEPMIRRDVIEAAGQIPEILFPIFTNGTFMDDVYFDLLSTHRNLVPIMSIEGGQEKTNDRRGEGVYEKLISNMEELQKRHLIYGASVTVTRENLEEVMSDAFLKSLKDRGCKAVIYVEYVPVNECGAEDHSPEDPLAPGDAEREWMKERLLVLRKQYEDMVFISFPGDEKSSGGCVAAGRGFFHINSHGDAEPCPFSPYSDINVRDTSLREAIRSKLFRALQEGGVLTDDHQGGCVLFEKKEQVEAILREAKEPGVHSAEKRNAS